MADFIGDFWGLYVAGIVAFGLLLCLVLLLANRTVQQSGAPQLKGHVWDENLREYNNPLPLWWLVLFLGTIFFSIAYLVIYPGFGTWKSTPETDNGLRSEYAREMDSAKSVYNLGKHLGVSLEALATDDAAMKTGQRLFLTYCSQCHGSQGKGSKGYPNLADNDWLFGGSPETIKASITDGRAGVMTPFGTALSDEQKKDVANYVRSLSGLSADGDRATRGKDVFAANCTVCHGPDGKGALSMGEAFGALGAPNLTDNVWLHDNTEEAIIEGITKGRNAGPGSLESRMPAWKDFLSDSEAKIHILAAYVYSLSKK
ncbi:MAG: cytochrome-c oxidase, cbb3-type subunit III [Betaproteobacteria bacterium]|nr:cytochrome-c oxidase, cbb3-type subunit III [Betaproteobacteria bacterium]MCL2162007.1 cytochrome-c oxidase, cbb3-type subunit III [Betaproteobacteria bacterium]